MILLNFAPQTGNGATSYTTFIIGIHIRNDPRYSEAYPHKP
jgi:hypothetical protein